MIFRNNFCVFDPKFVEKNQKKIRKKSINHQNNKIDILEFLGFFSYILSIFKLIFRANFRDFYVKFVGKNLEKFGKLSKNRLSSVKYFSKFIPAIFLRIFVLIFVIFTSNLFEKFFKKIGKNQKKFTKNLKITGKVKDTF